MNRPTPDASETKTTANISMAGAWSASLLAEILIPIACFLFLLAFLYHQITCRKSATPTNWPVLGMLPGLFSNIGNFHSWLTAYLRESGCTFRFHGPWFLGMNFLFTCDPANVNHVFNVNFANYPKGDEFLDIFDILGDGIFNADDESWKSQRKRAHSLMSGRGFRAFVARLSREKADGALLPMLSSLARRGDVVDLQDVFLRLTFDLTCNLVFGVDPGCLSEGFPTVQFARAMDDAMEALFYRHITPPLCWKAMRRLKIGKERKLIDAWGVIDRFAAESIANAKKREMKNSSSQDLLTSYIEESSWSNDDKFLRDTAVNLMLAGRDTTGVALAWFFWLLAKNPEVKLKIVEELRQHVGNVFDYDDVAKLVYLHAALCEALRLYPSVPFEHKSPIRAETLPSGMKAKAGEKILFSTYSMGRMEGVWGKDCLEFRPERWISERGTMRHEPSYKFLSFNCGPRTCLGKEIAFIQMKTVAAAMITNFEFELVEGHVVEPKPSIILHMKNGLKVRVKQRKQLMTKVSYGE